MYLPLLPNGGVYTIIASTEGEVTEEYLIDFTTDKPFPQNIDFSI